MMSWQAGHGHIEETLKSIFDQTYNDFQLLIYDDCSPDDPTDKIRSLITNDSRASFERGARRLGSSKASQYILDCAPLDTDFFAWISDHDLYDKNWLSELLESLEIHENAAVSYPFVTGIDSSGNINERRPTIYQNDDRPLFDRIDSFLSLKAGAGNIIWGLYRFPLLRKIGGWPMIIVPDIILLTRLNLLGSIIQVEKCLHVRREQEERENVMTSKHSKGMIARQIRGIFPSRPFYTYLEYRLVNSIYLLFKGPIVALFSKEFKFSAAMFMWRRYNKYNILPLIMEMPKRLISNRLTRYIKRKL